jgi:hypothetical protein
MKQLLEVHLQDRANGHHDFYLYAISHAFEIRGEWTEFLRLSSEYLSVFRFERGPVLAQLQSRISREI